MAATARPACSAAPWAPATAAASAAAWAASVPSRRCSDPSGDGPARRRVADAWGGPRTGPRSAAAGNPKSRPLPVEGSGLPPRVLAGHPEALAFGTKADRRAGPPPARSVVGGGPTHSAAIATRPGDPAYGPG